MSDCSEDVGVVKNGSNVYFGDYGTKESVIICVHVHFSDWDSLVTQKQETDSPFCTVSRCVFTVQKVSTVVSIITYNSQQESKSKRQTFKVESQNPFYED